MVRAHEESALKGERVRERRAESRAALRPGVKHVDDLFTRNVPSWIEIDDASGEVRTNRKKEATVHRIFEMLANGIGRHKIVKILNGEGVEALGPWAKKGWHPSHIHHLLHGRSVLGEFQPHLIVHENGKRRRVPTGKPIIGYFDPVVDHDLYNRAHAAAAQNQVKVGRKGNRYNNLLTAGMSRCDVCGSHMAYQDKGRKSVPNYTCSAAMRGACSNKTKYRHSRLEAAILNHVSEIYAEDVPTPAGRACEIELAELVSRRDGLQQEIDNVFLFIRQNPALKGTEAEQIAAVAAERAALEPRIAELRKEILSRSVAPTITQRLNFIASVRKTMAEGTDDEVYQKRAAFSFNPLRAIAMSARRKIETDFYMFTKLAGIQQVKANKFVFEGNDYTVNAHVSPEISASFGGRNRAYRLLRHAEMIEFICSTLRRDHVFGVVGQSFDQVSREHPFLRSNYEAARVGGFAGAWVE